MLTTDQFVPVPWRTSIHEYLKSSMSDQTNRACSCASAVTSVYTGTDYQLNYFRFHASTIATTEKAQSKIRVLLKNNYLQKISYK